MFGLYHLHYIIPHFSVCFLDICNFETSNNNNIYIYTLNYINLYFNCIGYVCNIQYVDYNILVSHFSHNIYIYICDYITHSVYIYIFIYLAVYTYYIVICF